MAAHAAVDEGMRRAGEYDIDGALAGFGRARSLEPRVTIPGGGLPAWWPPGASR